MFVSQSCLHAASCHWLQTLYVQPATFKKHPLQIRHPPTLDPVPGRVPEALCYTRHSSCPGGLTSQEPMKLGFHQVLPWDISISIFPLKIIYFVNYFLTELGLRCCSRAFLELWYTGFSLQRFLLFRITDSRARALRVKAWGLSCLATCGIFPDQGWNLCPLHRQVDSQPLATREALS